MSKEEQIKLLRIALQGLLCEFQNLFEGQDLDARLEARINDANQALLQTNNDQTKLPL